MFLMGELTLIYSTKIINEYQDVLCRPHLQISKDKAGMMLASIHQHGEKVQAEPSKMLLPDENDRIFYDIAQYANAYLITGNIKHYPNEPFIMTPADFLEEITVLR
jgi:predicted nucleic acid-binding protein